MSLPMDVHTGKRWLYCGPLTTQTMILRKREESGGESIGVCAESYISDSQTTRYIRITHFFFFFFPFIFISWRLITLQYCSGFCHTLT